MKHSIFNLLPTQFSLGLKEVEAKVKKMKAFSAKEVDEYLHSHLVPVIQHDEAMHLIDHHHLVRACWEAGIEHVQVEIIADLSGHSEKDFWEKMKKSNWVHLYDQFGNGPHEFHQLPSDIRGLADDVYRSLAWAVREAGGYEKTPLEKNVEPFVEFKWADYFRKNIVIDRTDAGFELAFKAAMKLTQAEGAKKLPGYKKPLLD